MADYPEIDTDPRLSSQQCVDCRNGMKAAIAAQGLLERCAKIGDDVEAGVSECKRVYALLEGYLSEFGPIQ